MMSDRTDKAVVSAIRHGLNSGAYGWRIIDYIKSEWGGLSPRGREAVRLQVENKLPELEVIVTEAKLHCLFEDNLIPAMLTLKLRNAEKWIDFYGWLTKPHPL